MKDINIEKTKYSLEVITDEENGIVKMSGASYPENAIEFFEPIIRWLNEYIEEVGEKLIMELKITYQNTSSSKMILDMIYILEDYFEAGGDVKVIWFYEEDDEDIYETGEELMEDFELPFKIIAY
ncbi:MAG: DUF1987 domain-containing protein [Candidatus Cloacimonadota bacterium]|nr:DUF1987 domain-containing protein [Candidatus Cloacimonadota bacterium]